MRVPKKRPMAKLHWSPRMAAHHTVTNSGSSESPPPSAAKHPAAKSSESPGRKGMTTTPVSIKMMRNSGAYTHTAPRVVIQPAMAVRGSWMRSMRYWMAFMSAAVLPGPPESPVDRHGCNRARRPVFVPIYAKSDLHRSGHPPEDAYGCFLPDLTRFAT